jgi:serine protease inhibitor
VRTPRLRAKDKLNLDSRLSILPLLLELGFPVAGDFSKMAPGRNQVQACIHRAVMKLDEEGTEAAAAIAVLMTKTRSLVIDSEILLFDRPFAFSIFLDESDAVIFTGFFLGDSVGGCTSLPAVNRAVISSIAELSQVSIDSAIDSGSIDQDTPQNL